ncbi:MAG TPA: SDR family oxidoreductase [Gemmatimonadaceae bacterium]|nr:SDR family oxidoreductase [Gemmatimonadaceae bacterium]
MDLGLAGKVALVSGASSGLGLAIARELAAEGVNVALLARRKEELEKHAAEISLAGPGKAVAVAGDVTKAGDAERCASEAVGHLGAIDILVANAGGPPSTTFDSTSDAQYQAAFELNLFGSIRLAHACVPSMRARKWGRVVFLTSMAAKQPVPGLLLSNTMRAGLLGFAKTLSAEVAREGVTVNTVLPGHFDTQRAIDLANMRAEREKKSFDEVMRLRLASVPMGRTGDPREMAALVTFLASTRAAFITGTAIQIDGGQVATIL